MIGWMLGGACFLIQLYFQIWLWRGMRKLSQQSPKKTRPSSPVSVIIAAHNEEQSLPELLRILSEQTLPNNQFEIILAVDRCTDATVQIARSFQQQLPNLRIIDISSTPKNISPKKNALQLAINDATFSRLVFLDADVLPTRNHLQTMQQFFYDGSAAIVSLMRLRQPKNVWENFLVFEKLISWCIAAAGVGFGKPVISYGGNWAYTRDAFEQVGGFGSIIDSLSGDDDLLLQKFGSAGLPIAFCSDPNGWVTMEPPESFAHFLRQRRRHFSAGKRYSTSLQTGYFFYHASNLGIWLSPLFHFPAIALLIAKLLIDGYLLHRGGKRFRVSLSAAKQLLFNFGYLVYNTLVGPLGHIGKIRW